MILHVHKDWTDVWLGFCSRFVTTLRQLRKVEDKVDKKNVNKVKVKSTQTNVNVSYKK